ncbi:MAG: hypothetical protein ABSF46_24615 [Terriglobia bacterium]
MEPPPGHDICAPRAGNSAVLAAKILLDKRYVKGYIIYADWALLMISGWVTETSPALKLAVYDCFPLVDILRVESGVN